MLKWLLGKFDCWLHKRNHDCLSSCFYECPYWRETCKERLIRRWKDGE